MNKALTSLGKFHFSKTLTVRDAINSAIDEEIVRDEKVFVIGKIHFSNDSQEVPTIYFYFLI